MQKLNTIVDTRCFSHSYPKKLRIQAYLCSSGFGNIWFPPIYEEKIRFLNYCPSFPELFSSQFSRPSKMLVLYVLRMMYRVWCTGVYCVWTSVWVCPHIECTRTRCRVGCIVFVILCVTSTLILYHCSQRNTRYVIALCMFVAWRCTNCTSVLCTTWSSRTWMVLCYVLLCVQAEHEINSESCPNSL